MTETTSVYLYTIGFGLPGNMEWIVLLLLGLLIFGRRLPDVGRSLGRGIVEFKKGIRGIEDDIDEASDESGKRLPSDEPQRLSKSEESRESDVKASRVGGESPNPYAPAEDESKVHRD